ncbi:MAG: hypothetical protein WAN03_04745 [Candidatus Sulfotelmatobacter sp.]
MSYRISQLSPQTSTRKTNIRVLIDDGSAAPASRGNMQWLRSWFEYDSRTSEPRGGKRLNWNALLGLGLMLGISSAFWTAIGLMISRAVR